MHRKFDVIVVGGGPVGSTAARICAKSGLKTLLVEEQAHLGYPVQCAGLLSNSAFSSAKYRSLRTQYRIRRLYTRRRCHLLI